jgi:autotransporter-associated beta strand protein
MLFNTNSGAGSNRANVRNGGAIIDTAGFNITIGRALDHSNVGGDNATDGGLTKNGNGTLTLAASNSYTGTTSITGGTLSLASTGSISSSDTINVGAGAIFDVSAVAGFTLQATQSLSGTGTVQGDIALAAGANIAPGTSPGTLTFANNLNLSATGDSGTGDLKFELGTSSDLVVLTAGALTLGTNFGFFVFTFTAGGGFGPGTYTLFQTTQAIGDLLDGNNLSGLVGGYLGTLGFEDSNKNLILNVSVVPEPGTFAMLLLGLGAVQVVRRRRNRG